MGWPRIEILVECTFISLGTDPGMTRCVVNGGVCLRNAGQGTCMYRGLHTVGCIKHDPPYAEWGVAGRMSRCVFGGER